MLEVGMLSIALAITSLPLISANLGSCSISDSNAYQEAHTRSKRSLYSHNDAVIQLNANNFERRLLNSPQGHLVEFYLTWCGHCRNFAPTYKAFAWEVQGWSNMVKVAAMNCDGESANNVCARNGATSVPVLKYYPRNIRSVRQAITLIPYEEIGMLKSQLLQYVSRDFQSNPVGQSIHLLPLAPMSSTNELWIGIPQNVKFYAVIFERGTSRKADEIILDLMNENTWLRTRKADSNHLLSRALNIQQFPSVAVFDRAQPRAFVASLSPTTTQQIRSLNPSGTRPPTMGPPTDAPTVRPTPPPIAVLKERYFVSETDLLKSIRFALHDQLATEDERKIEGERYSSLYDFVDMMEKYWPLTNRVKKMLAYKGFNNNIQLTRSETMRRIFNDLKMYLSRDPDRSVSNAEWKQEVRRLEAIYGYPFANESEWVHCLGSSKKYRGYTCGLWGIFHGITVNAYLQEDGRLPADIVTIIRNWIKHFVTCGGCTEDFLKMTNDTISIGECVRSPTDGMTYLWKAHNRINADLVGTKSEDPTFPKTQFPPNYICPGCGGPYNGKDSTNTGRRCDRDRGWDMRQVIRYLIQFYTNIQAHPNDQ